MSFLSTGKTEDCISLLLKKNKTIKEESLFSDQCKTCETCEHISSKKRNEDSPPYFGQNSHRMEILHNINVSIVVEIKMLEICGQWEMEERASRISNRPEDRIRHATLQLPVFGSCKTCKFLNGFCFTQVVIPVMNGLQKIKKSIKNKKTQSLHRVLQSGCCTTV